jgi:nitrogen fixation protein FixH
MRFFRLDDEHPLTGWHMLAIVCLFFGTVIAVNMVLAVEATGTFPGLVVENSYVASQHYDEMLAKARAQDEAGWAYELSADGGVIRARLSQHGAPLSDLSVAAHVGRPSTTHEDRSIDFATVGGGSYAARETLPPGLWEVDLEASRGGDVLFRRTQEVFVKPVEVRP